MSRRRGLVAIAVAMIVACVPATEDRDPRGGIGFLTVPSAPTRGEAFVTSDGWTVRVDTLVLRTNYFATYDVGGGAPGQGTRWRFRADEPVQGVVRALEPRAVTGAMTLVSLASQDGDAARDCSEADVPCEYDQNISPELRTRFERTADGDRPESCLDGTAAAQFEACLEGCPGGLNCGIECPDGRDACVEQCRAPLKDCWQLPAGYEGNPPGFYIRASATKDGRLVSLDLALASAKGSSWLSASFNVRPNDIALVKVALSAERLFMNPEHVLGFEDLARADANGDGVLTAYELRNVEALFQPPAQERKARFADFPDPPGSRPPPEGTEPPPFSMYDAFIERSAKLLEVAR